MIKRLYKRLLLWALEPVLYEIKREIKTLGCRVELIELRECSSCLNMSVLKPVIKDSKIANSGLTKSRIAS